MILLDIKMIYILSIWKITSCNFNPFYFKCLLVHFDYKYGCRADNFEYQNIKIWLWEKEKLDKLLETRRPVAIWKVDLSILHEWSQIVFPCLLWDKIIRTRFFIPNIFSVISNGKLGRQGLWEIACDNSNMRLDERTLTRTNK